MADLMKDHLLLVHGYEALFDEDVIIRLGGNPETMRTGGRQTERDHSHGSLTQTADVVAKLLDGQLTVEGQTQAAHTLFETPVRTGGKTGCGA